VRQLLNGSGEELQFSRATSGARNSRNTGDHLACSPLLPPFAHPGDGRRRVELAQGSEREIAILFADIHRFARSRRDRLPYDGYLASTALLPRSDADPACSKAARAERG